VVKDAQFVLDSENHQYYTAISKTGTHCFTEAMMIKINNSLSIPDDELIITASRSSGPGGQNVNKVSTKMTLRFNINETTYLTNEQKERARSRLKNIINKKGFIVLHEETRRSQAANRIRVIEKFSALMARALMIPKKRVPTVVSQAQKNKRREEKKIRARMKNLRRKNADLE
jgi:ribosome-associated protein